MTKSRIRMLRCAVALALTTAAAAALIPSAFSAPRDAPAWTYLVHRPAGLAKTSPVPLVVVPTGNIAISRAGTQLDAAADRGGFVVAYAQVGKSYNDIVHHSGESAAHPYPDMVFLGNVIDKVTASENIDPKRVYMTGASLSGTLAYRAACVLAGKVTGIAPVAAVIVNPGCRPSRPVSVFAVNGTADSSAPYNGGPGLLSVPSEIALWRSFDGCTAAATQTVHGAVTTKRWSNCAGGAAVQLATVNGGDHGWRPSGLIDTTAAVTAFFKSVPQSGGGQKLNAAVKHLKLKRSRSATTVLVRLHANAPFSVAATVAHAGRKIYAHSFGSRPARTMLRLRLRPHLKGGVYVLKLRLTSALGRSALVRRFHIRS